MTAFWIACATCVITLSGGFLALRFRTYQGVLFAFCAGALMAGTLMEILSYALKLLELAGNSFHHHHLLFAHHRSSLVPCSCASSTTAPASLIS